MLILTFIDIVRFITSVLIISWRQHDDSKTNTSTVYENWHEHVCIICEKYAFVEQNVIEICLYIEVKQAGKAKDAQHPQQRPGYPQQRPGYPQQQYGQKGPFTQTTYGAPQYGSQYGPPQHPQYGSLYGAPVSAMPAPFAPFSQCAPPCASIPPASPCPSSCQPSCCPGTPPIPGPQFLQIPPAVTVPTLPPTKPTKKGQKSACAPSCAPSCCGGAAFMSAPIAMPMQMPMQQGAPCAPPCAPPMPPPMPAAPCAPPCAQG